MIRSVIALASVAVFLTGCGGMEEDEALEKVSAGMTLAEVESLLGKGTPYVDVEDAKEKYGFSPDTPEGQRNTYLWFRPNERVYVATFTDGKLSFSFTKLPPGE